MDMDIFVSGHSSIPDKMPDGETTANGNPLQPRHGVSVHQAVGQAAMKPVDGSQCERQDIVDK